MDRAIDLPDSVRPDLVFSMADLVLQLDRLRRRAAEGTGRRRISLDQLARATGTPRSTLHTYLSGARVAPADVLDGLVIALGCTNAEVRQWAEAWGRVVDAVHASRSPARTAAPSKFLTFYADVTGQLTRARDQGYELTEPVVLVERFWVGTNRLLRWLDVRATIRATADDVDRCAIKIGHNPALNMDRLELTNLTNCLAGCHRTLEVPGVRVLEVLFGHALSAGETYVYEVRVDFESAQHPQPHVATPMTEGLRGFRNRGPAYTMEAAFPPADFPLNLRQVQLTHAGGEENFVRALTVNQWNTAHITIEHPSSGLHGIRWDWPDARG